MKTKIEKLILTLILLVAAGIAPVISGGTGELRKIFHPGGYISDPIDCSSVPGIFDYGLLLSSRFDETNA